MPDPFLTPRHEMTNSKYKRGHLAGEVARLTEETKEHIYFIEKLSEEATKMAQTCKGIVDDN